MTQHLQNSRLHPSRFHPCYIGLNYQDRQHLYDRINLRVDLMMEQGLLQEAKAVYDTPGLTPRNSMLLHLAENDLKTVLPSKAVKPVGFQLRGDQSFAVGGL